MDNTSGSLWMPGSKKLDTLLLLQWSRPFLVICINYCVTLLNVLLNARCMYSDHIVKEKLDLSPVKLRNPKFKP